MDVGWMWGTTEKFRFVLYVTIVTTNTIDPIFAFAAAIKTACNTVDMGGTAITLSA